MSAQWIELIIDIIDTEHAELTGNIRPEESRALILTDQIEGFFAAWIPFKGADEVSGVIIKMKSGESYSTPVKYKDFAAKLGIETEFELEP